MPEPLEWGVRPLPEQVRAAELMRQVSALVLALEGPDPALSDLVAVLEKSKAALTPLAPADLRPRVGRHVDGDGRVFIDHCRDMGAANPAYPVYAIEVHGPELATGKVTFPINYEGPAGCVNGGFLATFFDQIVQHHNCDLGVSGATRDLNVTYRRPTPLLIELDFDITREVTERDVTSTARITRDGEVLCSAVTRAATFDSRLSPPFSPRRSR